MPPGFREATPWEIDHRDDLYSDGAGGFAVPDGWETPNFRFRNVPDDDDERVSWGRLWHSFIHILGYAAVFRVLWHALDWLVF